MAVWAMGHHRKPRALGDGDARVEEALPEAVEVEGVGLCEDEALPIARIEAGQQLKLNLLMRTTVAACCANLARISTADTARGRFAGGRTVAVAMAAVAVLAIIAKAASSGARSDANHRRPTISWTWRGVCWRSRFGSGHCFSSPSDAEGKARRRLARSGEKDLVLGSRFVTSVDLRVDGRQARRTHMGRSFLHGWLIERLAR
jgi:hypothetical protein